jgi:hypothetical protein
MSKPNKSENKSATNKAELRASLPDLLNRATFSPEAAHVALRTYTILRQKPPIALLTKENIIGALPLKDIPKSLDYLSKSEVHVDISTALTAFRLLASQQLRGTVDRKSITPIGKAIASKLTKIATPSSKSKKTDISNRAPVNPSPVFTKETVSATGDLVLWILPRLFESQSRGRRPVTPLAAKLVRAFELIWRRSSRSETALIAVTFFNSLRRVLPKSSYADLEEEYAGPKEETQIATLVREANSALFEEAKYALLDGRLKELQTVLNSIPEERERKILLTELQDLCQKRPSEITPEAMEWVARQIDDRRKNVNAPVAADESQSSELHYIATSLLSAWDASPEGVQSQRSLENVQRLARELFKVDLAGSPGEIVTYDERLHSLIQNAGVPAEVEIVRPGVRWSDGVRTRFLVRAVVKALVR